jgi:anti-sigma factor RsiW
MSHDPLVPEADLQALVDGQLPVEAAADLEARVGENPELRARLASLRRDRDLLRQGLEGLLHEPVPQRLSLARIRAARRERSLRVLQGAMAACLLIGLGFGAGWFVQARRSAPSDNRLARWEAVADDAVRTYQTFGAEPRYPVELYADKSDQLSMLLSRGLGRPAPVPDLSSLGLTLVGGRIVPSPHGRAVMVLYRSADDEPVTLYVKAGETGESPIRPAGTSPVGALFWVDDGCAYVVASRLAAPRLQAIAEAMFTHFESGPGSEHRPGSG